MNKLAQLVVAVSTFLAMTASAQDIMANKPNSAYLQDSRGVIVRSGTGLCVRTGYYSAADAVPGCDAPIVKPAPVVAKSAPVKVAPAPAPAPVAAPAPTSEKVTFAADAFFDFDKAVLKPEGKAKLTDLSAKLKGMNLEVIIAVGHTDSVGTDAYNQKLSLRRAEAVKAFLTSTGIDANRVYTEGKGEKQPVADNKTSEGRAKNRRVEIEVVGTRTIAK